MLRITTKYQYQIIYYSKRNFGIRDRIKKWRGNSDKTQNKKTWLGEARRFLEYEEYNLYSFKEHLRLTVESNDKVGRFARLLRRIMKWMNEDAHAYQQRMIDDARVLLNTLDTFPKDAFTSDDATKYFKNTNKSNLGIDIKLHTSQIDEVIQKYSNNILIHKLLKKRVQNGVDLPSSADELHNEMRKPHELLHEMRKQGTYGHANPYKNNGEIYINKIHKHNEMIWDSPHRRRYGYNKNNEPARFKDWRHFGPKSYEIIENEMKIDDDGNRVNYWEILPNRKYRYSYNLKQSRLTSHYRQNKIKPDVIRRDAIQKKLDILNEKEKEASVRNDSKFHSYYS